jgi:hypothetical protein
MLVVVSGRKGAAKCSSSRAIAKSHRFTSSGKAAYLLARMGMAPQPRKLHYVGMLAAERSRANSLARAMAFLLVQLTQ